MSNAAAKFPRSPWAALRADTHRLYGRSSAALTCKGALLSRTFRPVVSLRLCQAAAQSGGVLRVALPLCKLWHRWTCGAAGLDLPWRTPIDGGFAITHGWGLVVNAGVRIGSNVTMFHGATLGRRDRISADGQRTSGYPVIENDVWIGPHAVIVGDVTIGQGSRIAAGAFVTHSVPPHSMVSGNPAVVVRSGCTPDVAQPAPLD